MIRTVGAGVRYKVIGALLTIVGMIGGMIIAAAADTSFGVVVATMIPGIVIFMYGRLLD